MGRIAAFVLLLALQACAAPAPMVSSPQETVDSFVPDGPQYGPGDTCADTYVLLYDNARTNFSLGSSNYQNDDFCGAYPYLKWLVDNEPLFTGEDPDDRNFLRLASTYEFFAAEVDSTMDAGLKKAYLDSALTTRAQGRAAMDAAGIAYDSYLRDLREGFFYYQYQTTLDDADRGQFDAFDRAYEVAPDSLEDWYLQQLFQLSGVAYTDIEARSAYLTSLAPAVDDPATRAYFEEFAAYLVRPEPVSPDSLAPPPDPALQALLDDLQAGTLSGDDVVTLLATALRQPERIRALGGDPDGIVSALIARDEIIDRIGNPQTLFSLSMRAFENGSAARGNRIFDRALANATSDVQRGRFYAARAQAGHGDVPALVEACVRVDANNAFCRFTQTGYVGTEARRVAGSTPEGRAAYWCMADRYRAVAAISTNPQITRLAREAATGYERAGPTREQYFFSTDWRPGDTVTASLGSYGRCATRVR